MAGKMNLSVLGSAARVLVVSQFTLVRRCAQRSAAIVCSAAPPQIARALYEDVVRELRGSGLRVETGEFQAMMQVASSTTGR